MSNLSDNLCHFNEYHPLLWADDDVSRFTANDGSKLVHNF